ncbi:neural cell adhesion molecule L1-like protein isoform X2 [Spea bombifrons]|uniref:neural cell adhesion molecule L1-like protein isoform X2 n=1 Tax=Spea bombifrons TaxID=233779 RepID=UPI00234982AA|nr:neural cell adhesion molecule L1-like protein isoform X2 [Spea bombifrons]
MTLAVHTSNTFQERRPTMMTPPGTSSSVTVLKGELLTLECIAEGLPTPKIFWQKERAELPPERAVLGNYGKQLKINDIKASDHGIYRCTAKNIGGVAQHDFHVHVEEPPQWKKCPESSVQSVASSVVLHCSASGNPKPEIHWKRNGQPLQRETLSPNHEEIRIENLQLMDSAVYQCEATNRHGSILASANIDVLDIAPLILTPDKRNYTVVLGHSANLHCNVFAVPHAKVFWYRKEMLEAQHMTLENGTLHILKTQAQDAGVYMCHASNSQGNGTLAAHLELLEPTTVSLRPENPWVKRSHSVTLTCHIHCDSKLSPSLKITWKKNGEEMTKSNRRINLNSDTLSIVNVTWEDAGLYSCTGSTSMDSAAAETRLSVRDVPSAPESLHLSGKQTRSMILSWIARDSQNSPISEYLVQAKKSRQDPGTWEDLISVTENITSVALSLEPYYNYEFRVFAKNEMGKSPPSPVSEVYSTPPAVPDKNPEIINIKADTSKEMIVTWEPLKVEEQNGPGFHYRVSWRRQGASTDWHHENVNRHHFLIKDTPAFVLYDVRVQSVNKMGTGPEPQVHTAYSGEDSPDASPPKVTVDVANSSVVKVSWIGISQDRVRGHLSGYKIIYWRVSDLADGKRHHADHHVLIFPGHREWGMIPGLIPFTEYKVSVAAFNARGDGPASSPVTFRTPEGVPEQPHFLRIMSPDSNFFTLSWGPPRNVNGILTAYLLHYQIINDTDEVGSMQNISIKEPSAVSWRVPRLELGTRYKFYLRACTIAGCGRAVSEEGRTETQATYSDASQSLTTHGWIIGLMCAIALLTLVLLLLCFVQRNKGGKYPVKEKEAPSTEENTQPAKQEVVSNFSANNPLNRSMNSISVDMKSYDSVDSLVQYSDEEHQQFNEDGSFIGEYTESKEK